MQRRLPVEQDDVPVDELPLDGVVDVDSLRHIGGVPVRDPDPPSVGTDDVVHTGEVRLVGRGCGTAGHHLPDLLDVVLVDVHGNGELPGSDDRDTDLVDGEQRIGRDDRTRGEVHTLSGQVGSETSLLTLEPLGQGLQGTAGPVPRRRDTGRLVVEVGGDVVLEQLPQVLDDQLGGTGVTVLPEPLVDPQDVDQLVGQVVLGPVSGVEGDGGPHGHGRDGQRSEHHPLGPAGGGLDSEGDEVLVGDPLEPLADLLGRELVVVLDLAECRGLVELDLDLLGTAVGADALPGRVLGGLLGEVLDLDGASSELLHPLHALPTGLDLVLGEHQPAALAAGGLQEHLDVLDEPDVDDGQGEVDVAEVPGALVHLASAGLAAESGLDDSHVGVHKSHLDGVALLVVGVCGDDLGGRHLPDLLGGDAGEFDRSDPLGDTANCHLKSSS